MSKQKMGRFEYALMSALDPESVKDVEVMTQEEEDAIQNERLRSTLSRLRNATTGEPLFPELIKH